jgi:hypothetical protein
VFGGAGEGTAVGVAAGRDGLADLDLGDQPAGPRHPPQGGEQGVVADEGGHRARLAPSGAVADADGLDRDARVQRGLEHGTPEVPLGAPAPGAALGEYRDGLPGAQGPRDAGDCVRERPQPVPVDEQGAAARGQRSRHRPAADLPLGEHPGRADGGEQGDVQPGDVVGDQQ